MCLSPISNLAVEKMDVKHLCPLVFCAFGWSFATTLPVAREYVPQTHGLTAYSFLTLFGVYVVAHYCRRIHDENKMFGKIAGNRAILCLMAAFGLILAAIGLNDYNSPFSLIIAGCVFFVLFGMKLPVWISRVCVWLGPTMFSVYLLHSHAGAWKYLKAVEGWAIDCGMPLPVAYFVTAICIFAVCVIADVPRRLVAFGVKREMGTIYPNHGIR